MWTGRSQSRISARETRPREPTEDRPRKDKRRPMKAPLCFRCNLVASSNSPTRGVGPWLFDSNGAPSTTRTCDLLVRSQTLYPTELWARDWSDPAARCGTGPGCETSIIHDHLDADSVTGPGLASPNPSSNIPGSAMGRRPPMGASPAIARTAEASARS